MRRPLFKVLITIIFFIALICLPSPVPSQVYTSSEAIVDQVARILAEESAQEKIKAIVLDFRVSFINADQKPSEDELKGLSSQFTEEFIADMMQKLNNAGKQSRIAVIDSSRLNDVLREKKLPVRGAEERTATELGALAGVDVIITGSVQVSGKASTTMVKVVRVKSGEILGIAKQDNQVKPWRPAFPPITIIDEVEKIEIGTWKALPVSLTHPGTLHVTIDVERGNPIDVIVIAGPELEHLKNNKEFASVSAFTAAQTKRYRRKADLESGSYYLVLRDSSVGVFSTRQSDIKVTVRLEP